MSIPGNATLLVFVMCKKVPIGVYQSASKAAETPPKLAHQPALFELTNEALPASCSQRSPALPITTPVIGELRAPPQTPVMLAPHIQSEKSFAIVPFNMDSAFSSVMNYKESQFNTPNKGNAFVDIPIEPVSPLTFAAPTEYGTPTGDAYDLGESANLFHEHYPGANNEARSTSNKKSNRVRQYKRGRKRKNPSILQVEISKKLKNSPQTRNVYDSELRESQRCGSNVRADPGPHVSMDLLTTAEHSDNAMEMAERNIKGKTCCLDVGQKSMPIIMFMNMADDNRKLHLTKFVERLGGRVTNDGGQCTHVVTGEARRTLNFCNALNTGAWVVSPAWLKVSVKEKRFVDEEPFILKDGAFESKYKTTLGEVIKRRKRMPHGLLQGVCVYPTKHVQPPVETISAIVLSAGGKVVTSFEEAKLCRETVVIACEDDISEALMAAKEGLATFSSEWLMSCIMKQELDRTSSQFAESL
ncbi:hypothetical protein KP509_20G003800 [Ceratopteris richardii]|nr:hypothetical protein KP509_20G003800 [Ceratopteris richardii]